MMRKPCRSKVARGAEEKALTLVELLVLLVILALLMGVLMSVLASIKRQSRRTRCGRNLSAIGKAMLIYQGDYEEPLPQGGGKGSMWWPRINNWQGEDRVAAFNLQSDGTGGRASISSSFYLVVKYVEAEPEWFICPWDAGTTVFRPADYGKTDKELIDLWDFGPEPWKHCSYAYHMPYGPYALTTASEPGLAVVADRSPWIRTHKLKAREFSLFKPDGELKQQKAGNSLAHAEDGQNVLFMDNHVYFEKRAYCAIDGDNIYTFWDGGDIRRGGVPVVGVTGAQHRKDSFLVHDPPVAGKK